MKTSIASTLFLSLSLQALLQAQELTVSARSGPLGLNVSASAGPVAQNSLPPNTAIATSPYSLAIRSASLGNVTVQG